MTLEALKATQEVAAASTNQFKDALVGFPEGESNIIILGQAEDYMPDNKTSVPMIIVGREVAQDDWRAHRLAQGSLASCLGLGSASEWQSAKDNEIQFKVRMQRQPMTPADYAAGRTSGKMKFTRL